MPLYSFYRIINKDWKEGDEEYIGGTLQPLHKRFYEHKKAYTGKATGRSNCMSRVLFETYGVDNCIIVLISQLECETFTHARMEERRIYEERRATVVNKNRPYRSLEELKEIQKAYKETHKDEQKKTYKAYRETHKEEMIERLKVYRETHKEEIKAYQKVYRETHKDQINAHQRAYRAKQKATIVV